MQRLQWLNDFASVKEGNRTSPARPTFWSRERLVRDGWIQSKARRLYQQFRYLQYGLLRYFTG